MKVDLQYFGGRGASSTRKKSRSNTGPKELLGDRFSEGALPELEGTEKQVKYAKDIRDNFYKQYESWHKTAMTELTSRDEYNKLPSKDRSMFQRNTDNGPIHFMDHFDKGEKNLPIPEYEAFRKGGAKDWREWDVDDAMYYHDGSAWQNKVKSYADNIERKYMHSNGIDSVDTSTGEGRLKERRIATGNYYRFLNDTIKRVFKNKRSAADWIDWHKGR